MRAPAGHLLAVAGDDEQGVVDGDADPDHRRHVGHEDRHLHRLREHVDQGAGDEHGDEAERERQRGRGERAEDEQQDDQDEREPGGLGLGEILLRELLHRRPQRALADERRRDAVAGAVAGAEVLAQVDGEVGGGVLVDGDAQRDDHRPAGGGPPVGLGAGGGGERDALDGRDAVADPRDRGAELRRRRAGLRHQHRGELRARHAREAGQRLVDGGRRRAGDAEAAAREVLGLAGGERERGEQDHRPSDQDEPPAAAEEAVEAEHRGLHGVGRPWGRRKLAGWPAKVHDTASVRAPANVNGGIEGRVPERCNNADSGCARGRAVGVVVALRHQRRQ